jgi:hypothetical protein
VRTNAVTCSQNESGDTDAEMSGTEDGDLVGDDDRYALYPWFF